MISTIIFDYGGVIGSDADTILNVLLKKHGFSEGEATGFWKKHWHMMKLGHKSVDELWADVGQSLALEYESMITCNQEVLKICRQLKDQGYSMGVLANEIKEWMEVKRRKAHLDEIFDIVYSSADIHVSKPQRQAYEIILNDLNAAPEDTLFIDNMQRNLDAADKLGIHTLLFTDAEKLRKDLCVILDIE
ncbi:HAD family phosphatase [Candidatus Woesearchaeota archaeon]|nr:HAD family phosphatase [Candidatus Woesearchaeota archaeon]